MKLHNNGAGLFLTLRFIKHILKAMSTNDEVTLKISRRTTIHGYLVFDVEVN